VSARRPGLDLATLPARSRVQAGPLLLVAVLVALGVGTAAVTPRVVAQVADRTVVDAVARAGDRADLVLSTEAGYEESGGVPDRDPARTASSVAEALDASVRATLGDVVTDPVTVYASPPLRRTGAGTEAGSGEESVRVLWVGGAEPVTWLTGAEPAAGTPVQVGLSEAGAAALAASAGDTLQLVAPDGHGLDVLVSGVFRAADPAVWTDAADALDPVVARARASASTQVGALLSDDSLPTALEELGPREFLRTLRFPAVPDRFGTAAATRVLDALPAVQASPSVLGAYAARARVHSGLPTLLRGAQDQIAAARADAASLAVAAVVVTGLLLLLVAGLLARRRGADLATRRSRGATLPALAVEHGLEALVVVGAGTVAGIVAAGAVAPGPVPLLATLPVALVGLLALPAAALGVAHRDDPRRGEAGHGGIGHGGIGHRRRRHGGRAERTGSTGSTGGIGRAGHRGPGRGEAAGRRAAVEGALVLLAAGALVASRAAGPGATRTDLLAAAAPAALAVLGGVLVARLLPLLLHVVAPLATRGRGAVGVLALARARSAGPGPLALVALTAASALVVVTASGAVGVRREQEVAALAAVGADVVVRGVPGDALADAAARWGRAPGVTVAVAARVLDEVPVSDDHGAGRVRLVVGDPAGLVELAASVAVPVASSIAPGSAERPGAGRGADGSEAADGTGAVTVHRDAGDLVVHPVTAPAPAWPGADPDRDVLVVDAAGLPADASSATLAAPDTVWVVGQGAAAAVRADAPPEGAVVTERAVVLDELRHQVLPAASVAASVATAMLLLVLSGLAVLVGAAAGGPARRRSLDTLRTVGLADRGAVAVALGEVLPGTLAATLGGAAAGVGTVLLTAGPGAVVAWGAGALPVAVGVLAAGVVVLTEHLRSRALRLGDVLRTAG
jgi:putative ABC transport system permease protein